MTTMTTWLRARTCQPMINGLALFAGSFRWNYTVSFQFSSVTSICTRALMWLVVRSFGFVTAIGWTSQPTQTSSYRTTETSSSAKHASVTLETTVVERRTLPDAGSVIQRVSVSSVVLTYSYLYRVGHKNRPPTCQLIVSSKSNVHLRWITHVEI